MALAELGPRICVMGPSNSGKSTLAVAIGHAGGRPVIHLDQLYHRPNTDWEPRPEDEFVALHDQAILGAAWIIDGNYSRCLPQRLARATGVILLDLPAAISLFRYFRRSWFQRHRAGNLEGSKDSVKWAMIRHILITTPKNRERYKDLFGRLRLPKVRLSTSRDLASFYRLEGLDHAVSTRSGG